MKKILVLAVLALIGISASAQVRYSRTMVEKKSNTTWYLRAGAGFNNLVGDYVDEYEDDNTDFSTAVGYELAFGFNRNFGKTNVYWGMELGLASRGYNRADEDRYDDTVEKTNVLAHNVKWVPFAVGYKYGITDDLKLDAHLGAFLSYDFAYTVDTDDYEYEDGDYDLEEGADAGLQVGIGVWYKRVNLDLTYQRGFAAAIDNNYYDDGNLKGYISTFMLRLGVSF